MSVRNKNEKAKLLGRLSDIKTDGLSVTKLSTEPQPEANPISRSVLKAPNQSAAGFKLLGQGAKLGGAVTFGAPPHNANSRTNSSSELGNLIKQSSTGVLSSILGGGVLGTLGGLFSDIAGWFGGSHASKEPLTPFRLPDSQMQDVSLTFGSAITANGSPQPGGVYGAVHAASIPIPADQALDLQNHRTQIVETVRLALLNSSSLNDVIGEM